MAILLKSRLERAFVVGVLALATFSPTQVLAAADPDAGSENANPVSRMVAPVNGVLGASGEAAVISPKSNLFASQADRFARKNVLSDQVPGRLLKGNVSQDDQDSPFVPGQVQTVPKGTAVNLTVLDHVNINSEISQKGDEVWMKVSQDVVGADGRVMPGGWFMHGLVTEAQPAKRGGRDGYFAVQFDKITDGKYEAPFNATMSTKDSTIKSVAKEVLTDSGYTAVGALGGALISLQATGIGGAIATHGISVGAGAAVGGTLGLFGSVKRHGDVASAGPQDDLKLTIAEPLQMPVFKPRVFQAAKPVPKEKGMNITVNGYTFAKDPHGDKRSRLLKVDVTINNHTPRDVRAMQLSVVNDFDKQFMPFFGMDMQSLMKPVHPFATERILIVYEVDDAKRKYWLSLHDNRGERELSRIPVNCQ